MINKFKHIFITVRIRNSGSSHQFHECRFCSFYFLLQFQTKVLTILLTIGDPTYLQNIRTIHHKFCNKSHKTLMFTFKYNKNNPTVCYNSHKNCLYQFLCIINKYKDRSCVYLSMQRISPPPLLYFRTSIFLLFQKYTLRFRWQVIYKRYIQMSNTIKKNEITVWKKNLVRMQKSKIYRL